MMLSYLLSITTLLPIVSDTPPALRIDAPEPRALRAVDDVVLTARLADGSRVPSTIRLPGLKNRAEVFGYLHTHYPDSIKFGQPTVIPVAWVYIDEMGGTHDPQLIVGSGVAAYDSLALAMVRIARFEPARIQRQVTPVWVMLPVQLSRAVGAGPQAPHNSAQPRFTPYTKKPELLNRNDVQVALVRNYPPDLRSARMGGTVTVWLYLNTDGLVEQALVQRSSNLPGLDDAALRVARIMAFSPAEYRGEKVAVWITVPVVFKTN